MKSRATRRCSTPASTPNRFWTAIDAEQLQLRHIFITHSHWDHVEALPKIREAWPKARLHSGSKNAPVDQRNKTGGNHPSRRTARDAPRDARPRGGRRDLHRRQLAGGRAARGDRGRRDFRRLDGRGNQSWDLARQKVREQILSLPPETLICPGHGPLTTVAEEKEHNPFF